MGLGSGIRKKPIPDPGSRGQKGTGSRIPDPDPKHCRYLTPWQKYLRLRSTVPSKFSWSRVVKNVASTCFYKRVFCRIFSSVWLWRKNVNNNMLGLKKERKVQYSLTEGCREDGARVNPSFHIQSCSVHMPNKVWSSNILKSYYSYENFIWICWMRKTILKSFVICL
jgi:hypothetical protein